MRWRAMTAVCALYAGVILYPWRLELPRWIENGAQEIPGRGWRFDEPGMVTGPPPDGPLDLRLRVRPKKDAQSGPARLATISWDTSRRNLLLGQDEHALVLRLRSYDSNLNGMPQHRIENVLAAGRWTVLRLTIRDRQVALHVDGERRFAKTYDRPPMQRWHTGYRLALGNEHSGNRPWLGEIEYAGAVERPDGYWRVAHRPRWALFHEPGGLDLALNFLCFFPFGAALLVAGWRLRTITISAFVLSLAMEVLQIGFAGRYTSSTDVLLNGFGALAGALIARRLAGGRAASGRPAPA